MPMLFALELHDDDMDLALNIVEQRTIISCQTLRNTIQRKRFVHPLLSETIGNTVTALSSAFNFLLLSTLSCCLH